MTEAAGVASEIRIRPLRARDRTAALAYLDESPRLNLPLLDIAERLGARRLGGGGGLGARTELLGAWREGALAGVAALAPSVVFDARADPQALEALFPYLGVLRSGLVKSTEDVVDPLWRWLEAHGRRKLLDRRENAYVLVAADWQPVAPRAGCALRAAHDADLEELVETARASVMSEDRPDPYPADPSGFRRWVRSRSSKAIIVEVAGRIGFVGYADVQCSRGWLLQGVYTRPEDRRRGCAAAGVSELCRQAFESGADHVQLAVVEGNRPAEALYERLGFERFARIRTLLFA